MSLVAAETLFRSLGIKYIKEGHHHSRFGWLQMHCPYCRVSNYHLGFNPAGNYFSCWRCGRRPLHQTLGMLSGASHHEVRRLTEDLPTGLAPTKTTPLGILKLPASVSLGSRQASSHRAYLRRRGFDWEYLEEVWEVKAITHHHRYGWRLLIPIHFGGEVVSFTTRALNDEGLRYLSASADEEKISHKNIVFGLDHCRHSVGIVEGPFDAFRIGPGASAMLGTGYKREQIALLSKFNRRIVCFDDEPAAQRKADRLCRQLMVFDGETLNIQLGSKDPGESDDDTIMSIRQLIES